MRIDGKKIAETIQAEIRSVILGFKRKPCLAVVIVGENPASLIYVGKKIEACQLVGIESKKIAFPDQIEKAILIDTIKRLNEDPKVDGILIQLPLPNHIDPAEIISHISPLKDVDGLHPLNMGKLLIGDPQGFIPCTPLGVQALIKRSGFEISGKHVVILGRSMIVGKPTASLMLQENATVSLLHSRSQNTIEICRMADIVVAAIGKPYFLTSNMVKKDAIIIDVGINRMDGKIVGDADYPNLINHCKAITPVPGGVGPMTIAMLLSNTLKSYIQRTPQN